MTPTSFAMYLRKHLGNRRLTGVAQHGFDRIVTLTFDDLSLVVELFARGNILLLDHESNVMLAMSKGPEERVSRGQVYSYPEGPGSPFEFSSVSELRDSMKQRDLVRSLAVDIGLGRLYANEACVALGLGRDMALDSLSNPDLDRILSWLTELKTIIEGEHDPVVYGGDEPDEYSPFRLHIQESEP